jgi:hypothetical protein
MITPSILERKEDSNGYALHEFNIRVQPSSAAQFRANTANELVSSPFVPTYSQQKPFLQFHFTWKTLSWFLSVRISYQKIRR